MTMNDDPSSSNLSLGIDDYLWFVGRAVRGMSRIVEELGDERANLRASVPGANSAYALLTHCLGVIEFWAGHLVSGRPATRDREAEFHAHGPIRPLLDRVGDVLAGLGDDVRAADSTAPLRITPPAWSQGPNRELNQAAALLHIFEEMSQHLGQMEVLRDMVVAGLVENAPTPGVGR